MTDPRALMADFDELPPELRSRLKRATRNFALSHVVALLQRRGVDACLRAAAAIGAGAGADDGSPSCRRQQAGMWPLMFHLTAV